MADLGESDPTSLDLAFARRSEVEDLARAIFVASLATNEPGPVGQVASYSFKAAAAFLDERDRRRAG